MKEFKGTKGEWVSSSDFREPKVLNESNQVIFTHNKNCYDAAKDINTYYSHNKMMSNTKLIAAAPDLLDACIQMKSWIDWKAKEEADKDLILDNIDKVISKALD